MNRSCEEFRAVLSFSQPVSRGGTSRSTSALWPLGFKRKSSSPRWSTSDTANLKSAGAHGGPQ